MTPEFHRPERVETIGAEPRTVTISAEPAECQALARRFAIPAIERLHARFSVLRDAAGVRATGTVEAAVTQTCSVTGEPLATVVSELVDLRFVDEAAGDEDEVELSADALDTMPIEDGAIDLGEATAETVALALDPFVRGPGAAAALRDAGVVGDDEVASGGAFAGLKGLLGGA